MRGVEAAQRLAQLRDRLAAPEKFRSGGGIEALLQKFVADEGIGVGKIIHAIRVAVTGKAVGFGLFETLAIFGREVAVGRIRRRAGPAP